MPALMGLPLLLNQCGSLSGQRYGTVLSSYLRLVLRQELEHCLPSIEYAESQTDVAAACSWIDRNVCPLSSEAIPARVVKQLSQMVASSIKPLFSFEFLIIALYNNLLSCWIFYTIPNRLLVLWPIGIFCPQDCFLAPDYKSIANI